jgi:ribonuclease P protein component
MGMPTPVRRRRDFERARRRGRRVRVGSLVLYVHRRPDNASFARLGLVVGSSCGTAVSRNRIKRRLRAAFSAAEPGAGWDVIAHASPQTAAAPFQELVDSIGEAARAETATVTGP